MKRMLSIIISLISIVTLFGCKNVEEEPDTREIVEDTVDEIDEIIDYNFSRIEVDYTPTLLSGTKEKFDKMDDDMQEMLEEYLVSYCKVTLRAVKKEATLYEYKQNKNDIIKFENNFSELSENNIEYKAVFSDFYELSYISAIYESKVLQYITKVGTNDVTTTVLIDDTYKQYINDLTALMLKLSEKYFD